MTGFVIVACGVLGLAVGSFLNVVIWRVPRRESIVRPVSRCPACGVPISPADNVPVLSWLVLRGRCRHCHARISVRYPLVEIGCGVLFGAMAARFVGSGAVPAYLVLAAGLLALSLIDLEHYLLPNRIVFPLAGLGAALLGLAALVDGDADPYIRALLGSLAAFGALFAMHLISPRGMGMGDVKLALVLGLYLGWLGWGVLVLGFFLGFLSGAVVGLALIALRLRTRKDYVPFGPFLSAGTLAAVLWGQQLLDWYLHR
jgi:leader peptidase (prepilin peptidase) / N-methyltransferase